MFRKGSEASLKTMKCLAQEEKNSVGMMNAMLYVREHSKDYDE
jgi:hypothetical protein